MRQAIVRLFDIRGELTRYLLIGFGWLCVALAFLGVIFPVLPTTPFLLVALWAFARSSPALAARIRANRHFGKYVQDWEDNRAIPFKAKILAIVMMTASWSYLYFATSIPLLVKIGVGLVLLAVAIYIASRANSKV